MIVVRCGELSFNLNSKFSGYLICEGIWLKRSINCSESIILCDASKQSDLLFSHAGVSNVFGNLFKNWGRKGQVEQSVSCTRTGFVSWNFLIQFFEVVPGVIVTRNVVINSPEIFVSLFLSRLHLWTKEMMKSPYVSKTQLSSNL